MIEVTVFPCYRKPGDHVFEILGCRVARSKTPFLAAARMVLEAFPESAEDWIAMRHPGTEGFALRAKVGVAAGLTVKETGQRPVFVPWRPFDRSVHEGRD
jgi:hypothetical protein